jgi:hypothetical protein
MYLFIKISFFQVLALGMKKLPIYHFFDQVANNTQGLAGKPGDKHYWCFHGNRKILTITTSMKHNQNDIFFCPALIHSNYTCTLGLREHLCNHFPGMYQLWEDLKSRHGPPSLLELKVAANKVPSKLIDCHYRTSEKSLDEAWSFARCLPMPTRKSRCDSFDV